MSENRFDVVYICEDNENNTSKYYEHYPTRKECLERATTLQDRYKRVSVHINCMP